MHTHNHSHSHAHDSRHSLGLALLLTAGFALIELFGGLWANSLALLGDAGHMATDAAALGLGALAATISRLGANHRFSYGLQRAEVLGALINVLFMFGVIVLIVLAAIDRLQEPQAVGGPAVMIIAAAGLLINLLVLRILHAGENTLNTRGAMLHVMGDLLGSVAALVAGLVIWLTGWTPIDPILSLLICGLILISSTQLLLESLQVVLEAVPTDLSMPEVGQGMAAADPEILRVHDLHIWTLSSRQRALSAHLVIRDLQQWPRLLTLLQKKLQEDFDIGHVTLQPEALPEWPLQAMPTQSPAPPGTPNHGH